MKTLPERVQQLRDHINAYALANQYADGPAHQQGLVELYQLRRALARLERGLQDSVTQRNRELVVIHQAIKEIDLPRSRHEEECRKISHQVTGWSTLSSGAMTAEERQALIRHYQSMGASAGHSARGVGQGSRKRQRETRPSVPQDRDGLMRWIEAMLAEKSKIEGTTWLSWRYVDGIARRMHGIDAVRFVTDADQLLKVAQALACHVRRLRLPPKS